MLFRAFYPKLNNWQCFTTMLRYCWTRNKVLKLTENPKSKKKKMK
jgi:hypothetical protein